MSKLKQLQKINNLQKQEIQRLEALSRVKSLRNYQTKISKLETNITRLEKHIGIKDNQIDQLTAELSKNLMVQKRFEDSHGGKTRKRSDMGEPPKVYKKKVETKESLRKKRKLKKGKK